MSVLLAADACMPPGCWDAASVLLVSGAALGLLGSALSPWLKTWFPGVFAPKKGGG